MSRSKLMMSLVGLTAIVGVSATSFAGGGKHGDCDGERPPRPEEVITDHAAEWNIPADVVQTLTSSMDETSTKIHELHELARAAETHTERFELRSELHEAKTAHMEKLRALLTADQFELLLQEMHPKGDKGRRGHRGQDR